MDESAVPRKRRRLFFESYSGPESTNVDGNTTCASMKEKQQQKLLQTNSTYENRSVVREEENARPEKNTFEEEDDDDTDVKLARLLSLFPDMSEADLLDVLVAYNGCVAAASAALEEASLPRKEKKSTAATPGIQTSLLSSFPISSSSSLSSSKKGDTSAETSTSKSLTKKGKTLYLYSPEDIARHTPCSIIHNFLPPEEADALLVELLEESKTFQRPTFQLFENTVQSPHTASLYVASTEDQVQQTSQYAYNGAYRKDVRQLTPRMRAVSKKVQCAVNEEIRKRIRTHYPGGKKLRFQSPKEWVPNAAFVNCYTGPSESVGYHSDQLTYLGPRAVIGSLSLGVAREFRVRRVVARDDDDDDNDESDYDSNKDEQHLASSVKEKKKKKPSKTKDTIADAQGQISIHLPHNSLLVMHAEMQEEWKHSVPPVPTISPHPISGNRRINITYRWYRESLHPRYTPRCRCGMPTVLRCVQRRKGNRGRYMWMCHAGYAPGRKGCSFFQWAEFDDDGEPIWNGDNNDNNDNRQGNKNKQEAEGAGKREEM